VAEYKTDDGEIIVVPAEQAFEAGAFYELPDGRLARRVNIGSVKRSKSTEKLIQRPEPSDNLGFTELELAEKKADAEKYRDEHRGIEFKPDPDEPSFYQVHFADHAAKKRYMKHRKVVDRSSKNGSGAMLSPAQIGAAQALVRRIHGTGQNLVTEQE